MHRADLFLPSRPPTFGRLQMTSGAGHCGPERESETGGRKKKAKDWGEPVGRPLRTRTGGGGGEKGRCVVYGERSGAGSHGLGGESASREGRGVGEGAGGGGSVMASGRGASSRWFFTREQLENTPSRRCGVEADKELSYRQQAANLIQDMGQRLNVYPFLFLALRRSRPVPPYYSPGRLVAGPVHREHGAAASAFSGPRLRCKGREARAREAASGQ